MRAQYPILEYDPTREAIIEPGNIHRAKDVPEHCVVCFFPEVVAQVCAHALVIQTMRWEDGEHRIYEIERHGQRLGVMHPGVGAPVAVGLMEAAIHIGFRKFIACGGAGVLNKEITVGHLVVPTSAIRDEGTSYHYLPPAREVSAHPAGVAVIEQVLQKHRVPYLLGKTWTTDAPYRETRAKVQLRKSEGCLTVDMEASAFFALAQFREVIFAQMLYGGDDVSGEGDWDSRDWQAHNVREHLFALAAEACLLL